MRAQSVLVSDYDSAALNLSNSMLNLLIHLLSQPLVVPSSRHLLSCTEILRWPTSDVNKQYLLESRLEFLASEVVESSSVHACWRKVEK